MNVWVVIAAVIGAAILPCLAICLLAGPTHALAAFEVAGVLATTALMALCEGFHRQPFIDLALVLAPLSALGSLVFARMMERDL